MSIRPFEISTETTRYTLSQAARGAGLAEGRVLELADTLDVLRIWEDRFDDLGQLFELEHRSPPHDPPDCVARFTRGSLDVEHTIIDPPHIKKAEVLWRQDGGKRGRNVPRISHPLNTKEDLRNEMYGPGGAWEPLSAALSARSDILSAAITRKTKKYPRGGLLVMTGDLWGDDDEGDVIRSTLQTGSRHPDGANWIFAIIVRWSSVDFFSAMCSSSMPFEVRRS